MFAHTTYNNELMIMIHSDFCFQLFKSKQKSLMQTSTPIDFFFKWLVREG